MRSRATMRMFLVLLSFSAFPMGAQPLPADAQQTCTVPAATFQSWFRSGSVSLNGAVNPADSLELDRSANCNFYRWAEQMFLWLTSPTSSPGGGRVFNSAPFYDVSDGDEGARVFIPHLAGSTPAVRAAVRQAKPGPNGFPAVVDRRGQVIEIVPTRSGSNGRPLVRDSAGKQVEVAKVVPGPGGRVRFFDAAGKEIAQPKPILSATLQKVRVAQRFYTDERVPVLVGPDGIAFEVDPGQAVDNAVLVAQNRSVIFYSIAVNDAFAYFLTGVKKGAIQKGSTDKVFPTTASDLNDIVTYAARFGKTLANPNALVVEVKTSWIEATNLPNPDQYITMTAAIPTYDRSDPRLWKPTGTRTTKLAMLGMHVVGSTNGHPEMLWATFEHFGNAPNAGYTYVTSAGVVKTVPQDTSGSWLLTAPGSKGLFNIALADYDSSPKIEAARPKTPIGPSDTLRTKPFGAASNQQPNADDTVAASNTLLISVNNSVLGQLAKGDVRANYYQLGTTWTKGGAPPTTPYPGNQIGTSYLANSTMETYQQGTDSTTKSSTNCLGCHRSRSTTVSDTHVSHIFHSLVPLMFGSSDKPPAKPQRR